MPTRRSILAIHPGALGDVVLFGHLLSAMEGPVTLVAGGEKARLLAGASVVAGALDFDGLPMHEAFTDDPPDACRLPALLGGCDRLITCFAGGDARAERRLAELAGASDAAFLPTRPPAAFQGHLLDLWGGLLGIATAGEPAPWPVPDAWREAAAEALAPLGIAAGTPYAAIHPGAGAEVKCWPLERFGEVAAGLRDAGLAVVFTLGPVELDRWADGRIERLRGDFPVLAAPELGVLAGVLAGAETYLGNDSGVSHLAAAVGTPTLALFGPTDARHFRPVGRRVRCIEAPNMEGIGAGEVLAVLRGT